jgi:hypothetical protein
LVVVVVLVVLSRRLLQVVAVAVALAVLAQWVALPVEQAACQLLQQMVLVVRE